MSDARLKLKTGICGTLIAVAVVTLSACELMLAERPPERGAACPTWRGGCQANVDFATNDPTPTLRATTQLEANELASDLGPRLTCTSAPWICQLEQGADILQQQYFDQIQ